MSLGTLPGGGLMKRIKNLLLIAVLAFAVLGGWRAGSCELADLELQEDMLDLATQTGSYRYATGPRSDEDYREAVIRDAREHDIQLEPSQVTVRRTGSGTTSRMYLAADYTEPVTLAGHSFTLHFTPTSEKKLF